MTPDPALDPLRDADRHARSLSQTVFDRPLVLEAGAGTGKTATLVGRVLAWCLGPGWRRAEAELRSQAERSGRHEDVAPERIAVRVFEGVVAITFTEAAAAEMAARIGQALALVGNGTLPIGVLPEALDASDGEIRSRAGALLVALDRLVVATIHAFCRRILAGAALEAGVHPSFAVDAEGQVLAEVVQETLATAYRTALGRQERNALVELAGLGHGPEEVTAALTMLASKGVSPKALAVDPLGEENVSALAGALRGRAEALRSLIAERVGGPRRNSNAEKIAEGLAVLAGSPAGSLDDLTAAVGEALPDNLVGYLRKWRNGDFNGGEAKQFAAVEGDVTQASGALIDLVTHVGRLDPDLLRLAWQALAPLLAEVSARMRARGAETFAALLRDTRDLLHTNQSVRRRLSSGMTQLLVDEFQDTDVLQCEILRLLAFEGEPGQRPGLFLIGDPKQSIYGWRSADLEAYEGFLKLVQREDGEVLNLVVNFRSRPAILAEVERVVRPVMLQEAGVQPAFQTLLPCPERMAGNERLESGRAPVEHWVSWALSGQGDGELGRADAQQAAELEARALASDLSDLHRAGTAWREAAVLLRSTGDLDVYLQALREAGVPYLVERDRSYYRRREIIEAAALVRAVLDPGDHLALLAVLRSSLVGVPDAALMPLWARQFADRISEIVGPDATDLAKLRADVRDVAATLPDDIPGLERVQGWELNLIEWVERLAELRKAFARESAADFVERLRTATLFEVSEAARTLGAYRVANLDRFFRTLHAAMEADGDPHAVLRALRVAVAEARDAEEGRPLAAAQDAVRVMTIHKAKGLDFTHVYLMQTHRRVRTFARPTNDCEEIGGRFEAVLLGAPTPGWHLVEARRRRVEGAELVRTLYVAMTRAKDRLVVAGNWSDQPARPARSHMDLLAGRDRPEGGLAAAAARLHGAGGSHLDSSGARWVFPALSGAAVEPAHAAAAHGSLPFREEIARQSELLASLGSNARERMKRPFSARASADDHRELDEQLAEASFEETSAEPGAGAGQREVATRDVAKAVGSAVHRALEQLDLDGDLAASLARQRERLSDYLAGTVSGSAHGGALVRARAVLDHLAASHLLGRLREIAPYVIARELAVLLPPEDRPDAPVGFVAGAIDLIYRDASDGELVIADYKTDDVSGEAEIAARAAVYAPQCAAYRQALQQALGLPAAPRVELWFVCADRIVAL